MKKCPQCQELFDSGLSFCLTDGTPLIEDPPPTAAYFSPSAAQPFNPPFVVDLLPKDETPTQVLPKHQPNGGSKNYAIPLLIGLLLGGGLVLATILVMKNLGETNQDLAAIKNSNSNTQNKNTDKNENSNKTQNANTSNSAESNMTNEKVSPDKTAENQNADVQIADKKRKEELDRKKRLRNFNGRVIALNANLRLAPTDIAPSIEVLPFDEPIKIGKPVSSNNVWFSVTTASGKKGWMHGDWIKCVNPKTEATVTCPR